MACVGAGVASGATDMWARSGVTCKRGKHPVRVRGLEPATRWLVPWSLTTGQVRSLCLDLVRMDFEVDLEAN